MPESGRSCRWAERMALSWWDIPGPSRFVKRVENDLRDRVNVVAALPAGLGREWFDFFRRRWSDDQNRMDVLRVREEVTSPGRVVHRVHNPSGGDTAASVSGAGGGIPRTDGRRGTRHYETRARMDGVPICI